MGGMGGMGVGEGNAGGMAGGDTSWGEIPTRKGHGWTDSVYDKARNPKP